MKCVSEVFVQTKIVGEVFKKRVKVMCKKLNGNFRSPISGKADLAKVGKKIPTFLKEFLITPLTVFVFQFT